MKRSILKAVRDSQRTKQDAMDEYVAARVNIKSLEGRLEEAREKATLLRRKAKDAGNTSAELKTADDLIDARWTGTEAVSYTHLDVYKRQVNNIKRAWRFLLDNIDYPVDWQYIREYNRIIGEGLVRDAGRLREYGVRIGGTGWVPEIPTVESSQERVRGILEESEGEDLSLIHI